MSDLLGVISELSERINTIESRTPPEPRWAIITSISPLRVRIETETDPLPITPINAAGELNIGSRVLAQRYGAHIYLWGPRSPIPHPPVMPFGQVERTSVKVFESSTEWQDVTSYSATNPGIMLGGIQYSSGVFTTPIAGLYRVTASCRWGAIAGGIRGIGIKINGVLSPHYSTREPLATSGELGLLTLILPAHHLNLSSGSTISLAVYQNSGQSPGLFAALFTVECLRV